VSYFALLKYLVVADFKTDVNRYFLGVFWWFVEPLMYVAVYYVAFSHLRAADENYVYFLIVGITTWRWLAGSINQASNSIISKKRIISHFSLNPIIFALSAITTNSLKFLVLLAFVCVLLQQGGQLQFAGLQAMLFWFVTTLMCLVACSLLSAFIVVYIPDMRVFISQGLMLLLFLSGVIFSLESVGPQLAEVLQFNPFVHLISGIRYVLLGPEQGSLPHEAMTIIMVVSAIVVLVTTILSSKISADIPKRLLL